MRHFLHVLEDFFMNANLLSAGFDAGWLVKEVKSHGAELEQLLVDGLAMGLSNGFLVELVGKLGLIGIQIVQDLVRGGENRGLLASSMLTKQQAAAILSTRVATLLS